MMNYKHLALILVALLLCGSSYSPSVDKTDAECYDINTWYRPAPSENSSSDDVLELDMSFGYAVADAHYIYIVVRIQGSEDKVVLMFVNGSDFYADEGSYYKDPPTDDLRPLTPEEFENYMKNTPGTKIERKY